ncbi:hypothetical protein DIC66_11510 [Rhodoferax lacus]|uniref:DUF2442 domain-containing protein n=1 Tax=Rhodoferax lacus TaxID=2184758 RepID=A0A3E1RC51_9BURK|nr:DUF2442 domain-containing protein [Rhodoferax lacus]RFO96791.1 hypothetical protein DIC66_11510 [Rhodoferax lacus]
MSEFFYPKLESVTALELPYLRTVWSTGEVLDVDLSKILRGKAFAEIRKPEVFRTVHTDGQSIEWFDTELGSDNVYAWAKEQAGEVSHDMFGGWMLRNQLSLSSAAEALGISRRMVSYYRTAAKSIPRAIWLACLGWEVTRPEPNTLPMELPSAKDYAAAHA